MRPNRGALPAPREGSREHAAQVWLGGLTLHVRVHDSCVSSRFQTKSRSMEHAHRIGAPVAPLPIKDWNGSDKVFYAFFIGEGPYWAGLIS